MIAQAKLGSAAKVRLTVHAAPELIKLKILPDQATIGMASGREVVNAKVGDSLRSCDRLL